jgi:hypothetical protein
MAVVKGRITERIPSKVAYAYLEIEAANVNEFNSLRAEALASEGLEHYAFALNAPTAAPDTAAVKAAMKAAAKKGADVGVEEVAAEAEDAAAIPQAEQASSAPAPTESVDESPREKARRRLLEKKGA